MALRDTDVEPTGTSLGGCKVVLGVTGASLPWKRCALLVHCGERGAPHRHHDTVSAAHHHPAVRWASQADVITDWDGDLTALNEADAVLVAPATRDVMASHLHGLQHGPLMMALSVARSRTRRC